MLIAKYTCNASGVVPTFNSGYAYEINETENEGVYTVEITSDTDFSSCSFRGKSELLTIEYLKVTSKITSVQYMFSGCTNLTSLDLSSFDTSNITDMSYMFNICSNLTSLDVSNFDTSNVTTMYRTFYNCTNLTSLDLSNWDTSKLTIMDSMFNGCNKLTTLNVSNFNTSNVTTMYSMFNSCNNLTSLDLSNFNTSNVISMASMFYSCNKLTSLDVSNFDTSKVTNMASMFQSCNNLTSIDVSNWDTSNVTNMSGMFSNCNNLTTLDLSNFDTSKVTSMGYMFNICNNLTTLDLSNFNTSKVTGMHYIFAGCTKLTSLDVSNFNTSEVTNMGYMFQSCTNLTSLDLSNFNTSKVTTMDSMFRACNNLTSLDVSNWDTSNVTNMAGMFYSCNKLTSLDVSNFDTSKVTTMDNMFYGCTNLTTLDVSNFNTSEVTRMDYMFFGCTNLTSLDLSNFDTSKVTNMSSMFNGCNKLTTLDVSNFNTSNVTIMSNMIHNCNNLTMIGLIYADINTLNKLSTPSTATLYVDADIDQTAYTGNSSLKVYEQRTITINIPIALRSNGEIADRIYWNDEDKHYYIEQNIDSNTNEILETPNIIASGIKQPIYLKTYENMLSVGIQNIQPSYMSVTVPFFEIPTDYEYNWEDELDYIKQSFELRFPDEDDVEEGWGFMGIPDEEGTGLKVLIDWVDKCTDEEFVRDFDQHFNKDYTLRYFLLVITLGMVDNLGKNMMLDTWDNKIFMPRFYDCDTICSYDNSGQLKFDVDIEMAQGYWNTSSSRLWTRIRDLMHDELIEKYNNMRQNGLSYESLMECFYDEQIAKIPQKYYNMDYDVKYGPFADSYIGMANGDTYEHVKRWLQQRLRFVDTLYDYAPSYNNDVLTIRANTTEPMTLEIETYTPVYQHLSWYNNQMDKKKIDGKTSVSFTGTAMAATDQEVLIYGGSNIKSIKGITSMNPNRMLIGSATRLIELDAPNCPLLADINANKSNLAPHTYLNKLNLRNCPLLGGNLIVNNSPLLREIDITGTGITGLNLPSSIRNLAKMNLPKGITSITLNDAPQLHTLELEDGAVLESLSMTNCNGISNTNIDVSQVPNLTLNNSYDNSDELYLTDTVNLSLSNMNNIEKVIYTPNNEYEQFDIFNVHNAPDYKVTTFNCPNLNTFMTTAPYRISWNNGEYGEIKPDEVFIANSIDISNTQFKDVKLLCTTDTNVLKLPTSVKNLIVDSAYDLDTAYLTDGDYNTIHTDFYEFYNTVYESDILMYDVENFIVTTDMYENNIGEVADDGTITYNASAKYTDYIDARNLAEIVMHGEGSNSWIRMATYDENKNFIRFVAIFSQDLQVFIQSNECYIRCSHQSGKTKPFTITKYTAYPPNIVPSASDGSLIFSMYAPNKAIQMENTWNMKGLELESFLTFGLNNDIIQDENGNITMPNRYDNYVNKVENLRLPNEIATYTASDATTFPAFNSEFAYTHRVAQEGDVYEYRIYADSMDNLPTSISFNGKTNLLTVEYLNTSQITNMNGMFQNCSQLTQLDVSNWDTSKATNMVNMFYSCSKLTQLDVSNWDTSNVTGMNGMFQNCSSLTQLDVSNWDTSKATNMSYMFSSCSKLTQLDVSNWDTSQVTNMNGMFQSCSKLTQLDVSNWKTSKATNMVNMFYSCSKLTQLDVSNWDTSNVTDMYNMFAYCSSLQELHIDSWPLNDITQKAVSSLPVGNDAKNEIYASVNFTVPSGWTLINATTRTMIMDQNDLANLTDEEIAALINDGWTIG